MENNNIANFVNIFACVRFKIAHKCFRVETSCYRLAFQLNFIVTVELLYDQLESDFFQCQTKNAGLCRQDLQ